MKIEIVLVITTMLVVITAMWRRILDIMKRVAPDW